MNQHSSKWLMGCLNGNAARFKNLDSVSTRTQKWKMTKLDRIYFWKSCVTIRATYWTSVLFWNLPNCACDTFRVGLCSIRTTSDDKIRSVYSCSERQRSKVEGKGVKWVWMSDSRFCKVIEVTPNSTSEKMCGEVGFQSFSTVWQELFRSYWPL